MFDFDLIKEEIECSIKNNKKCVLYLDCSERDEFLQRLVCSFANVSFEKAVSGNLEEVELLKLFEAKRFLSESKISITSYSNKFSEKMQVLRGNAYERI